MRVSVEGSNSGHHEELNEHGRYPGEGGANNGRKIGEMLELQFVSVIYLMCFVGFKVTKLLYLFPFL